MAKSLRTTTSAASGTVTAPTGLTIGDQVVLIATSDTASATLTPPSDGNTWTEIVMGSESGGAASTLGAWWSTVGSAPANFTVAGATIAATICIAINPGGDTVGTPSLGALTSATSAGAATITSSAVNASANSVTLFFANSDDGSGGITTPPSGMTQEAFENLAAIALAAYSILNANNATYTNSLTWTTNSIDRMAGAISFPYTTAGPTIDTQPTAQTCTVHNSSDSTATFTVAATTSGGALSYQWQFEDSAGSGTYTNITNGGIYSGATTASVTFTPTTKTSITGRRVRCNVTDSNGTTTTNAVMLTIYDGFQFTSSTSATTNGSGVATVTWTDDRPGSLLGNGGFVKGIATSGAAVSRTSQRPT